MKKNIHLNHAFEECDQCHRITKHFHFNERGAHKKRCTGCDSITAIELWELTCSCGKQPEKKSSGSIEIIECAHRIPVPGL